MLTDEFPNRDSSDDRSGEGDAEEYGDAGRDGRVRRIPLIDGAPAPATADDGDEEDRQRRIQHHLQHRVHRDEDGAVFAVAAREARPDEHHRDAARQTHEDQSVPQTRFVRQERPGEREHEEGRYDPVDEEGKGELDPHFLLAEGEVEGFEFDFAEDRVHHHEQTYSYGDGDADEFPFLQRWRITRSQRYSLFVQGEGSEGAIRQPAEEMSRVFSTPD